MNIPLPPLLLGALLLATPSGDMCGSDRPAPPRYAVARCTATECVTLRSAHAVAPDKGRGKKKHAPRRSPGPTRQIVASAPIVDWRKNPFASGVIVGHVADTSGMPLAFAQVLNRFGVPVAYADSNGRFVIPFVRRGVHALIIQSGRYRAGHLLVRVDSVPVVTCSVGLVPPSPRGCSEDPVSIVCYTAIPVLPDVIRVPPLMHATSLKEMAPYLGPSIIWSDPDGPMR